MIDFCGSATTAFISSSQSRFCFLAFNNDLIEIVSVLEKRKNVQQEYKS